MASSSSINLVANHFPVDVRLDCLYHYDICIYFERGRHPESTKKKTKSNFRKKNIIAFEDAKQAWSIFKGISAVYDGERNCYTNALLPGRGLLQYSSTCDDQSETYTIEVQPTQRKEDGSCVLDMTPLKKFLEGRGRIEQEILTALTLILRYPPSLKDTQIYQGFFKRPAQPECIDGLEVWPGYCFSLLPGPRRLHFNLDLSYKLFYPHERLLTYINRGKAFDWNSLKFVRIYTVYRGTKISSLIYSICRNATEQTFDMDGNNVAVKDYFKKKYNIILQHPHLPVLNVGKVGPAYLPIELCYIEESQPFNGALSPFQQDLFTRQTAVPPEKRFQQIDDKLKEYISASGSLLTNFKIAISKTPLVLMGTKIRPPTIKFKDSTEQPKSGSWQIGKFCRPCPLTNWIVISFCRERDIGESLNEFLRKLGGNQLGIEISKPLRVYYFEAARDRSEAQFVSDCFASHKDLKFVVMVLSNNINRYSLKHTGDIILKIPTICIREKHFKKNKQRENRPICHTTSFINNILLKVNSKQLGINWVIADDSKPQIFKKPLILMGADVNHASYRGKTPSISAVVMSKDKFYNHYIAETREQPAREDGKSRTEIIMDFEEMVRNLLTLFKTKTCPCPASLLFFRDGVGEGQFEEVREKELKVLMKVCQELFENPPRVTFVIVVKRHHTRFKPQNRRDGSGKLCNIPPGTLVSSGMIQERVKEFFLCSQACLQGTISPTKYCVLHDDNQLRPEDLNYTTFCLCHLYMRCSRSISIPVVVQHAHHWALKGKDYFLAEEDLLDDDFDEEGETDESAGNSN